MTYYLDGAWSDGDIVECHILEKKPTQSLGTRTVTIGVSTLHTTYTFLMSSRSIQLSAM